MSPESAYHRDYFYVGGYYADDEKGARVMQGQMYVEQLIPLGGAKRPLPLVFFHGAGQTATNWLNTPDGRKGWATYFIDQGYMVYLTDSPTRGRSRWQPSNTLITLTADFAEKNWTATAHYKLWPQAELHTQWPGSGRMGDPIFDAFYASQVQFPENYSIEQSGVKPAGAALLDRIGPAILITHSQGGPAGWLLADARPKLAKAIIAVEPAGPPFVARVWKGALQKPYGITDIPLTYDPPPDLGDVPLHTQEIAATGGGKERWLIQAEPARKLVNLMDIPVVLVTAEASYHSAYEECTVKFLKQAGVDVQWLKLAEHGIKGNGHFMFMELNNLEIAKLLESRIAELVL